MGGATTGATSGFRSAGIGLMSGAAAATLMLAMSWLATVVGGGARVHNGERALHARVLVPGDRADELEHAWRVERELAGGGLASPG